MTDITRRDAFRRGAGAVVFAGTALGFGSLTPPNAVAGPNDGSVPPEPRDFDEVYLFDPIPLDEGKNRDGLKKLAKLAVDQLGDQELTHDAAALLETAPVHDVGVVPFREPLDGLEVVGEHSHAGRGGVDRRGFVGGGVRIVEVGPDHVCLGLADVGFFAGGPGFEFEDRIACGH